MFYQLPTESSAIKIEKAGAELTMLRRIRIQNFLLLSRKKQEGHNPALPALKINSTLTMFGVFHKGAGPGVVVTCWTINRFKKKEVSTSCGSGEKSLKIHRS